MAEVWQRRSWAGWAEIDQLLVGGEVRQRVPTTALLPKRSPNWRCSSLTWRCDEPTRMAIAKMSNCFATWLLRSRRRHRTSRQAKVAAGRLPGSSRRPRGPRGRSLSGREGSARPLVEAETRRRHRPAELSLDTARAPGAAVHTNRGACRRRTEPSQLFHRCAQRCPTHQCVPPDLIDCGFTNPLAMRVNFSSVARSSSSVS
jgi:hypothetical protein